MALTNVFVTVGTTRFDKLINIITSQNVLKILKAKGCVKLIIQIGNGIFPEIKDNYGINIEIFRLKTDIDYEVKSANLIIGHAGAGTCLQSLQAGKRLIVIVNDELMNNHQTELATKLFEEGYIHLASCNDLEDVLNSNVTDMQLRPYGKGNVHKYVEFIDNVMGFNCNNDETKTVLQRKRVYLRGN